MVNLSFLIGYPFFWFLISLAVCVIIYLLNYKKIGLVLLFVSTIIGFGITPVGSEMFLESVSGVFVNKKMLCDPVSPPKSVIMLPGGLTSIGPEVLMTRWTASRVDWLNKYADSTNLVELILPGGDIYKDKKEGLYIKSKLDKQIFKSVDIKIGEGSYSTYSNLLEITDFNEGKMYGLVTSKWHGFRAIKVARKIGFDVCLLSEISNKEKLMLKEYPWAFKAALREYLAIAWYKLKGRI